MTRELFSPAAVLFDLDGVLVHSYPLWFHLLNDVAGKLGYPAVTAEAYEKAWGQSTAADREAFFPNHTIGQIEAAYDESYTSQLVHLEVPEGVSDVFARLDTLGIPSALCTNTQASLARVTVAHAGASPRVIVGGDDVDNGKPAPDMLLRACERLEVAPERAWMVGDSRFDREAAQAAGVFFAGRGIDGDARVEELKELPGLLTKASS